MANPFIPHCRREEQKGGHGNIVGGMKRKLEGKPTARGGAE